MQARQQLTVPTRKAGFRVPYEGLPLSWHYLNLEEQ